MSTKPHTTKRPSGTLTKLENTLGLSKRRVSALLAQGMPSDPRDALAWRTARENEDTTAALRRERIKLVKAQRERAELDLAQKRGELMSRDEVGQHGSKIGAAVAAALRALEVELPQLCLGLPLEKSRPAVKTEIRKIQTMLADATSEFWANHPEQ